VSEFSQEKEAKLLDLLGQELGLFKQIYELTEKQTQLVDADDVDAFDQSLDQRQKLIDQINGLHQESDLLMQSYVKFNESPSGKKSNKIDDLSAQIRSLIVDCANLNEKNLASAKEVSKDYSKRIEKLNISRKTIGKYAQGGTSNSELFDKKT